MLHFGCNFDSVHSNILNYSHFQSVKVSIRSALHFRCADSLGKIMIAEYGWKCIKIELNHLRFKSRPNYSVSFCATVEKSVIFHVEEIIVLKLNEKMPVMSEHINTCSSQFLSSSHSPSPCMWLHSLFVPLFAVLAII